MPEFEDKAIKFLRDTEPTTITPTLMPKKLYFATVYIYQKTFCILLIHIPKYHT